MYFTKTQPLKQKSSSGALKAYVQWKSNATSLIWKHEYWYLHAITKSKKRKPLVSIIYSGKQDQVFDQQKQRKMALKPSI